MECQRGQVAQRGLSRGRGQDQVRFRLGTMVCGGSCDD